MTHQNIDLPACGEKITFRGGKLNVPDQPVTGCTERDGIGPGITTASLRVSIWL